MTHYEEHQLAPATVLRGHRSEGTAYLVADYPYGFRLRCQIRYWLHTGERGSARGQVRLMSQTTNPKVPGEPWNKPKASTYSAWAIMYLDSRGHVGWWPIGRWGPRPGADLRFRLRTLYDQLTETERNGYDALHRRAVRADPESWDRAGRMFALVANGVDHDALRDKHGLYVSEHDYEVAVAARDAGLLQADSHRFDQVGRTTTGQPAPDALTARLDRLQEPTIGRQGPEPPATGLDL